jgi:ferredoxin
MAYKITEDCISCGACESECPNNAIKEGDTVFVINPDRCTECVGAHDSPKCAEVCPVDAPKPDAKHVETKEALLAKYKKLHP